MSDENGHLPVVKNPNLRPAWQKGQSGNPEGKNLKGKNGGNSLKQAIIAVLENEFPELGLTEIPVDHIRALINKPKTKLTNRDVMAAIAVHSAFNGDFRYFKEIMDRIDGPVSQKAEVDIITKSNLEGMTDEELALHLEDVRKKRLLASGE